MIVVTARDEADRIAATLDALARAFPAARILVADDGSRDATAAIASSRAVEVVAGPRHGKGETAGLACAHALSLGGEHAIYLLCDGDLGASAARLVALQDAVVGGSADLAIAAFEPSRGGGFGVTLGFARWAVRSTTGARLQAPLSGQRALRSQTLAAVLPFAAGFGMELAMTIDTLRSGWRVVEIPLELEHRWTARSVAGFRHRGRQLRDCFAVYLRRRRAANERPTPAARA